MQKNDKKSSIPPSTTASFPIPPHLPPDVMKTKVDIELLARVAERFTHTRRASKLWTALDYLLLIFFGALYATAFSHFNWPFIAWCGLVPLFFLTAQRSWRAMLLRTLTFFIAWGVCAFAWIGEIHYAAILPLGTIMALFSTAGVFCTLLFYNTLVLGKEAQLLSHQQRFVRFETFPPMKQLGVILAGGCFFIAFEYLRSFIFTGLPWNTLAATQWQNVNLLQLCEYTGLYGISFCVFTLNLALYFAMMSIMRYVRYGRYCSFRPILILVFIMLFVIITVARRAEDFVPVTPEQAAAEPARYVKADIGVIQCDERTIWNDPKPDYLGVMNRVLNQTHMLCVNKKPDIVVWPETIVGISYLADHPAGKYYRDAVKRLIDMTHTPLLIGTPDDREGVHLNLALLVDSAAVSKNAYAKTHLVPFGEFIPLASVLDYFWPNLRKSFNIDINLNAGKSLMPLEILPGVHAGISICFEDVFDTISRAETQNGANVLITITNDAWYPKSNEREQHLANAVFRAVENRRYVVRTGNMARACLIAPTGQIIDFYRDADDPSDSFDAMKRGSGGKVFNLILERRPPLTFFTRYGNVFAQSCSLITILGIFFIFSRAVAARKQLRDVRLNEAPESTHKES